MSFENDKEAKNFAGAFVTENKSRLLEETKARFLWITCLTRSRPANLKELPIIVKADVQGSVEAVKQSLTKLSNEEVVVKVIHGGVGAINESDVSLAQHPMRSLSALMYVRMQQQKRLQSRRVLMSFLYKVHLQAIEDVEAAMKGMLDPYLRRRLSVMQRFVSCSRHPVSERSQELCAGWYIPA